MSYKILDVEVSELRNHPEPVASLSPNESGLAMILRHEGNPLGFVMQPLKAGSTITRAHIAGWVSDEIASHLVREKLRQRLVDGQDVTLVPDVTVAICTKDRPERLARCLASIAAIRQRCDTAANALQVLVVDNAPSNDATRRMVSTIKDVGYVVEPLPGLNFARNRALRSATTDVVAYIDDDVVVDRHWLTGLLKAWRAYPRAIAVTGQVFPLELSTKAQIYFEQRGGFRRGFERRVFSSDRYFDSASEVWNTGQLGTGCNMAFRRQTLLELGGFDEALDTGRPLPGGGDHDILYRVIRNGHLSIYEPTCVVFHEHRQTLKQLSHQYWTWGTTFLAFASKCYQQDPAYRPHWRRGIFLWFLFGCSRVCRGLMGRESVPVSMLLRELFGGIVGLFGGYRRSVSRIARIKKRADEHWPA